MDPAAPASADDPLMRFSRWMDEARRSGTPEPTATALATVLDGRPSVRMVLLKAWDASGLVFSTSYISRKAREIEATPYVALTLFWHRLDRQLRAEGRVERTSAELSDAIFAARPRGSQLAAWASTQSAPIDSRAELERRHAEMERRFENGDVPRPPFWGGYRLIPDRIEFWEGRPHRLHERQLFVREAGDGWRSQWLAP